MCIYNAIKTFNRKPRKAYKVVNKIGRKIYPLWAIIYRYVSSDFTYRPRGWNIIHDTLTTMKDAEGFHVYTNINGALSWQGWEVYEVLVDNIKYKGNDINGFPCLIVGKFKFIKRIK